MKSITVETLSGKKFFIDNVGDYFMVNDESFAVANFFSTINDCLEFIKEKA